MWIASKQDKHDPDVGKCNSMNRSRVHLIQVLFQKWPGQAIAQVYPAMSPYPPHTDLLSRFLWFLAVHHMPIKHSVSQDKPINSIHRYHSHIAAGQILRVTDGIAHLGDKHLHLLEAPAQDLPDGIQGETIQTQVHVEPDVLPLLLEFLVFRPRAVRNGEDFFGDFAKAGFRGKLLHHSIGAPEGAA